MPRRNPRIKSYMYVFLKLANTFGYHTFTQTANSVIAGHDGPFGNVYSPTKSQSPALLAFFYPFPPLSLSPICPPTLVTLLREQL